MYLNSNLKFLTQYNTKLNDDIHELAESNVNMLNIDENFIFKLQDNSGNEFYSGSIYDPLYEAKCFLDGVNFDNTGYFLMGLNSSATLIEILKKKTDMAWLFVVEQDLELIKNFLEELDLSPYLENKPQRLVFFYGEEQQVQNDLIMYLQSLVGYYFLQAEVLRTFPSYKKNVRFYNNILETFNDSVKNHVFNMGNDLDDTLLGIKNELSNLNHILDNPRLKDLKEKYKGKPVICVSTGPSLDKQLPLLKQVKNNALIISAESAMRVLLRNDIVPDVVCILERIENSFKLSIEGVQIPEETVLIGLSVIDPRIFNSWPKNTIPVFKENLTNSRFMNEAFGDFGSLYCGNSVAHMCYALANYFGGEPIIIIGQDLAYSNEGTTHSKDSFYNVEEATDIDVNIRKKIQESLNTEGMHNKQVYLDGYYGGKVRSRLLWQQFLIWYEHHVAISNTLTLNCTEGGVHIKGTERIPFEEAIQKYCQEQVPSLPDILEPLYLKTNNPEKKLKSLSDKYEELQGKLDNIKSYAEENKEFILRILEQLTNDLKEMDFLEIKLSRILNHNENVILLILEDELISFYLRPLIAYMHVQINPISRIDSLDRAKKILNIHGWFMENVIIGIDNFKKTYEKGLGNLIKPN